jgi:hypothetical protein
MDMRLDAFLFICYRILIAKNSTDSENAVSVLQTDQ